MSAHGIENLVGHGLIGGLSSVASGGSFQSGFVAAGFADLATPVALSTGNFYAGLAVSTTAGGIGDVLGGGKFENGAVTGAFGYLFNQAEPPENDDEESQSAAPGSLQYGIVQIVHDVGVEIEDAWDSLRGVDNGTVVSQGPRYARGALRQQVLDKGRQVDGTVNCAYCGQPTATQSDHIVPYSKGGPTTIGNIDPSCGPCNASKGASDLGTEWVPPIDRK